MRWSGGRWAAQARRGAVSFLAIFLGVSLSFLAEDWRESLNERREARHALEGIMADLSQDLPSIRGKIALDSAAAAAGSWLHRSWDRPDLPADSLDRALDALHEGGPYSPIRSEYESAKNAGRLQLIENEELRGAITRLYERSQSHNLRVTDITMDFDFELWRRLRPYVVYAETFTEPVVPSVHMAAWPRARADTVLRNALVHATSFRRLHVGQMRDHLQATIDLREAIGEELGAGRDRGAGS